MSQEEIPGGESVGGIVEPFEELTDVDSARSGIVDMAAAATRVQVAELPLATLYDLALPISIELGRTSMTVQEVLQLGRGSVIELDRLAGEPVDIFVGDRRFAEGEVVVLGENFGVRITRILPNPGAGEAA
jgi:flagellar motor switch protein FliN